MSAAFKMKTGFMTSKFLSPNDSYNKATRFVPFSFAILLPKHGLNFLTMQSGLMIGCWD